MNPFEAPHAQLEVPIEIDEQESIRWGMIGIAGAIYVVSSILIVVLLALFDLVVVMDVSPVAAIVLFFSPWASGAAYLAWMIRRRWFVHGLIYAVIPPLVLTLFAAVILAHFALILLIYTPVAMVISIFITFVTMAMIRLLTAGIRTA